MMGYYFTTDGGLAAAAGQFELGGQVRVLVDAWKGAARVDLRQVRTAIE